MTEPDPEAPEGDPLFREAAGWFARMRGPQADESRAEFEAWLRRGALHRMAYNRAAEIFAVGKVLKPRRNRRLAVATASAVVLAGAALCLVPVLTPGPKIEAGRGSPREPRAPILTAVLNARGPASQTFRLADGSSVTLQPGTLLHLQFTTAERRLDLDQGLARFAVFHEPRPFVVHAGGGTVTARGTLFDVAVGRNGHVTVKLIEGFVDVSAPPPKGRPRQAAPSTRLKPGMTMSFAVAPSAAPADAEAMPRAAAKTALAPPAARDFEAVTLDDIVAEANQSASTRLRLGDESLGKRRVAGRFSVDDANLLAERLAILFDLVVDRSHPGEIILRRRYFSR